MTIQRDNKNILGMALLGLFLVIGACSAADTPNLRSRNLIIGGSSAIPERFPYYVALKDADREIQCGGTLIAPDIVLTAAHCRNSNLVYAVVGQYSKIYEEGFGEEIPIWNPYEMMGSGWSTVRNLQTRKKTQLSETGFMHPQFDLLERTYDVMLLKLERPAIGHPLVMINANPRVPLKQPGGMNEITIIGMGNSEPTGWYPKPATLRQVHVNYLPYEECIDFANNNLDYKYELLPHMMCTQGSGIYSERGQCYGDSGGPYILMGDDLDGQDDLQVAVVSWAVNCANPLFPMVGSRTSHSIDFIKEITCSLSSDPPDYLCLAENNAVDPSMLSRYDIPDGVKVSVRIYSDPFGHELRWKIADLYNDSIVYAEAPYGHIKGDHSFQDVMVPAGGNLKFEIEDAADDGIYGNADAILYEVVLVGTGGELTIVEGNGQFGTSRQETFKVPTISDEYIAMVRASKVESKKVVHVSGPTAPVTVYIDFADYHEDASWTITSHDGIQEHTLAYKNFDHYRFGANATEKVDLEAGDYTFTINDRKGTGEYRAFHSYRLSFKDGSGQETELYQSMDTLHGAEFVHNFTIPATAVSQKQIVDGPTVDVQGQLEAPSTPLCPKEAPGEFCTKQEQCCSGRCRGFRCVGTTPAEVPQNTQDKFQARIPFNGGAGTVDRGDGI